MAPRLQELCALLVEDACGQLCSQIFTTLAETGRLARTQIQQRTRMPARQLRTALAVLVQQHLILHYTAYDGDVTFYQVDWRNAYHLARSHRIISLVEDRYGEGAAKAVANLLQLGHARVGQLAHAFDLEHEHGNGEVKVNGTGVQPKTQGTKINTVAQFHSTLRTLLHAGFLIKLGHRAYMPHADMQSEVEEAVICEQFPDRKVTGPKKQAEFKSAVNSLKRKWREANEYSELRDTESRGVIRQPGMQSNKRMKLHGGLINGTGHGKDGGDLGEESIVKLPKDMVLRVNYAQCVMALRSQRLEELAEPYLGGVTAHIYGVLLHLLETKMRVRDGDVKADENSDDEDEELPVATTMEVAEALDPSIDLTLGIAGAAENHRLANGEGKLTKKVKQVLDPEFADIGIKQEAESDSEDGGPVNGFTSYRDHSKRLSLVEEHLKLLEEHPKGFCRRVGGGGHGEWRVQFSTLTDILIQADIDSTVISRYGKAHGRIIRLLRERGRLEEKQIAAYAMMRKKDVCVILTELQYAGLAEPQEVPKDSTRQSARTHYLWFHDQSRAQSLLLQQTYQGMSRTLQRLRQERENFKSAIEKAEMDVKPEALNQNERDAVMQWREVEEKLLTQVHRLDDMVALFRDFSGKDTSLIS